MSRTLRGGGREKGGDVVSIAGGESRSSPQLLANATLSHGDSVALGRSRGNSRSRTIRRRRTVSHSPHKTSSISSTKKDREQPVQTSYFRYAVVPQTAPFISLILGLSQLPAAAFP